MNTYIVTERASGVVVYRFESDTKTIWDQFPESEYDYTQDDLPQDTPPHNTEYGGRRKLTKLEFRRLFTRPELEKIDQFAANYLSLGLGVEVENSIRTNLKSYDEAEDISLDDPDIYTGLQLYAAIGIFAVTRIAEVLNG